MHKILYLGLKPPKELVQTHQVIHYPIIKVLPRSRDEVLDAKFRNIREYTCLIFTSRMGVEIFCSYYREMQLDQSLLKDKHVIAVGRMTAASLANEGLHVTTIAQDETAEGIVSELRSLNLKHPYYFWPHSNLSRSTLIDYFKESDARYAECILYDTVHQQPGPLPDLSIVDEIIFTSPSTVHAFENLFGGFPKGKKFTCIGPVTLKALTTTSKAS